MENKKGELVWDELIPWIIGFGVLMLGFVLYFILSEGGGEILNYIKNLFKFGS